MKVEGRAIVRIGRRDCIIRIQVLRAIIATIVSIATNSRNAKARIETLKQQPDSFLLMSQDKDSFKKLNMKKISKIACNFLNFAKSAHTPAPSGAMFAFVFLGPLCIPMPL